MEHENHLSVLKNELSTRSGIAALACAGLFVLGAGAEFAYGAVGNEQSCSTNQLEVVAQAPQGWGYDAFHAGPEALNPCSTPPQPSDIGEIFTPAP